MLTKVCADPVCERKGEPLPLTEFSIHRQRKDGRNIYCRQCTTRRVHEHRTRKRAYKAARKPFKDLRRKPIVVASKQDVNRRVLSAIRRGARTRSRIKQQLGLSWDDLTHSLAELWDRNEITIKDDQYYPRAA